MFIATPSEPDAEERIVAFAGSDVFEKLFREGMDLVEDTAAYLDGEGRTESRRLERASALAYASESMRLTTRLMQAASWLLVQRAVREGEMSAREARDAKYRLGARTICGAAGDTQSELPPRLRALLDQSALLYERIDRLDSMMFQAEAEQAPANPVNAQLERLQAALSIGGGPVRAA
jgi:regulator of CtrA degradation